jgi:meiotically up-regulated gene 157 (Mug157) protein
MYVFQRKDWEPFHSLHQCRENPDSSCGLVKSAFRSSMMLDYFLNIPNNAFFSTVFYQITNMLKKISN